MTNHNINLYKMNGSFALKYVSVIKNEDSSSFFKKVNDRVMINKEGLDVVSGSVNVDLIPGSYEIFPFSGANRSLLCHLLRLRQFFERIGQ